MIDIVYYGLSFVVALGILVAVHEFGHFWVARKLGVKVLRFSIGFGKPLWQRVVGPDRMEFVIGALPLGGYVKMLGEADDDVPASERHRAFSAQAVWKRALIVLAGPAFNLGFAILAYWAVFASGIDGIRPLVGKVVPGSIAAQAGFVPGELLVSIDGKEVQSWTQRRMHLFQRALEQRAVEVVVRTTDGQLQTRTLDLSGLPVADVNAGLVERGIGLIGYFPEPLAIIGAADEKGAAAAAGLAAGDRIVDIGGVHIETWEQLAGAIRAQPGNTVRFEYERAGVRRTVDIAVAGVVQDGKTVGRIGIRPQFPEIPEEMKVRVNYGLFEALGEAAANTWSMSWLTLEMLWRMLKLEVSTKNISGPITIAQYAGQSAKIGLEPFVMFLAVISISLGVLNLLPIPILDGGHLVYYLAEAVIRRPLPERVMIAGQQVGIVILAGLMLLAFYNDIARLFF